jgi:hypothetical protein
MMGKNKVFQWRTGGGKSESVPLKYPRGENRVVSPGIKPHPGKKSMN